MCVCIYVCVFMCVSQKSDTHLHQWQGQQRIMTCLAVLLRRALFTRLCSYRRAVASYQVHVAASKQDG